MELHINKKMRIAKRKLIALQELDEMMLEVV